ncbi:hypothetical protein ANCCAN_11828 [Ancylostoma caninum]|uniref:Uncharacterized protein n=1 Tax=Ancylostoma caninum TaxID=29170 RepID=A0A368GGM3_ANCCA|nr:hypothetical protein ANCCAN_11828 [Ancylostoma caninum]
MQARKIRYDVIGLTETRRHRPVNANFDTGEQVFLVLRHWYPRQHELGHEHRFNPAANKSNGTFAVEKMWINTW